MPDYQKMYFVLFHEISKTIERLQAAQLEAEELYISSTDVMPRSINNSDGKIKNISSPPIEPNGNPEKTR